MGEQNEYYTTESELLKGKKYQDLEGVMALRCGLDIDELVKINGERFKDEDKGEDEDMYSKVSKEVYKKPIEEIGKETGRQSGSNTNKKDAVNHPSHYANKKYEPIAVINDWKLSYNIGNCVKYLSRAGLKDDIKQDMNKAVFYLLYECKKLGLTKEQTLKTIEAVFDERI